MYSISVNNTNVRVYHQKQTVEIDIIRKADPQFYFWSYIVPSSVSWVHGHVKTNGDTSKDGVDTLILQFDENNSLDRRTTIDVRLQCLKGNVTYVTTVTLDVRQNAYWIDGKIIFPSLVEIPNYGTEGHLAEIKYTTDTPITTLTNMETSADWLIPSSSSFGSVDTLFYLADEIGYNDPPRYGNITVSATTHDGYILSGVCYFKQNANPWYHPIEDNATIDFLPPIYETDYTRKENISVPFISSGITSIQEVETNVNWISINSYTLSSVTMTISENYDDEEIDEDTEETNEPRKAIITFWANTESGNLLQFEYTVLQYFSPRRIINPIWKDATVKIDTENDYIDYRIVVNNNVAYKGRAFVKDGQSNIYVNDILKDYLDADIDLTRMGLQNNNEFIQGSLEVTVDGEIYTTQAILDFYNDWSYEEGDRYILNDPISNEYDTRQLILTTFKALDKQSVYKWRDSTSERTTLTLEQEVSTDVEKGITNNLFYRIRNTDLEIYPTLTCYDYCLYYLNAYGGWDSFLIKGKALKKKKITFNTIKRNLLNTLCKHNVKQYQNTIKNSWNLTTSYLTDEQSKKLYKHLIGSPRIYLHNLSTDEIRAVNMVTNSAEEKSYRNQGLKMFTYNFEVEDSFDTYRR